MKHTSHYQNEGLPKIYVFFSQGSYNFRRFQSDGEFSSDPRRSDRESTFAQVKLRFRNNKLEINDLTCLWLFERCKRQAKSGRCLVKKARYVRVDSLNFNREVGGSQCNCLSSGSDGEKQGAICTTRATQCCPRWSLYKSLLAMLFSSDLQ